MRQFIAQTIVRPVAAQASAIRNKPIIPPARPQRVKAPLLPAKSVTDPDQTSQSEPATSSGLGWAVVVIGLLIVVVGGVGYALWKKDSIAPVPEDSDVTPLIAKADLPSPKQTSKNVNGAQVKKSDTVPPGDGEDDPPPVKEPEKKTLVRSKLPKSVPLPPEADPVVNVPASKVLGVDQDKINAAIAKGIGYLRQTQHPLGRWAFVDIGHTSLAGLTLLECDVPAKDPVVQRAAAYVREGAILSDQTYDLATAILFLDRLGDPQDRARIQGMALRLLAGQSDSGRWKYACHPIDPPEMFQLYVFLQANVPNSTIDLQAAPKQPRGKMTAPVSTRPDDPFLQLYNLMASNPTPPDKNKKVVRVEWLKPGLRNVLTVRNYDKEKGQLKLSVVPREENAPAPDNSNTQFAMLALWAARRHDVRTEKAILAAYQAFTESQADDGGWNYQAGNPGSTNTMTCAGLLALAMGHGVSPEVLADPDDIKKLTIQPAQDDPRIQKALKRLASQIGEPAPKQQAFAMENLYYLWSIERVAMLYDMKTIAGKDWYGWGAQSLLGTQSPEGYWVNSNYVGGGPPHANTCFGLLFLKRSNLVRDLTEHLRLQTPINNPDR